MAGERRVAQDDQRAVRPARLRDVEAPIRASLGASARPRPTSEAPRTTLTDGLSVDGVSIRTRLSAQGATFEAPAAYCPRARTMATN